MGENTREALSGRGKENEFELLLVVWGDFLNLIIYSILKVIL